MDDAQTYVEGLPLPGLADQLRTVWVQSTGAEAYVQRNLPAGGVEVHCVLGSTPTLIGPLTVAHVQIVPAHTTIVGVRFWPGAVAPLLGVPADELLDRVVPLDELWAEGATKVGEHIDAAPDAQAALVQLQLLLLRRIARSPAADPLVAEAVRRLMPWRPTVVGTLSAQLAISPSQLRRRLSAVVGVGPKTLQRTLRFQGYLALAQAAAAPDRAARHGLSDLAAEAGYADHPHLSRECLRLTGLTPTELLAGGSDQCGCAHDHSASYGPFLAGRPFARRSA